MKMQYVVVGALVFLGAQSVFSEDIDQLGVVLHELVAAEAVVVPGHAIAYGTAQLPAQGKYRDKPKDYCEDRILIINEPTYHYKAYAVFDGHGGDMTASLLVEQYPAAMEAVFSRLSTESSDKEISDAIITAYQKLDSDLHAKIRGFDPSGSTATALIVWHDRLLIVNTGDSRTALLLPDGTVLASHDHKPTDESERERIAQAGGFVAFGRVAGVLALSRAFGDRAFGAKVPGLIADPEVIITPLTKGTLALIACDGIWDTLKMRSPKLTTENYLKQLQREVASGVSVADLAQRAVHDAQRDWLSNGGGYSDDISAIIVKF